MYKKCYATRLGNNKYKIHLWDEGGYDEIEWYNTAYQECSKDQEEFKDFWQKHESDPDVAVTFKKDKKNSLFDQDPLS